MVAKNPLADRRPLLAFIESNHQQVGKLGADLVGNFRFLRYFSDNFNARLVRECGPAARVPICRAAA